MRNVLRVLVCAATLFAAAGVQAQKIEGVKWRLATPATAENGAVAAVRVREAERAAEVVRRGEASAAQSSVNGFRVVIFFDNGNTARAEAERILAEFGETYADIRCDIRYENPYFKVLAGNCVNSEDAVILLGRIRSSYPDAYIMREEMPAASFITPKPVVKEESDDEDDDGSEDESLQRI